MAINDSSVLEFVKLFSRAVKDIIQRTTGEDIQVSKTAMKVNGVQVTGEIGAFVAFNGDYSGIMILNFEGDAALEIVSKALTHMGMPETDIPTHVGSDEVRQSIGELTNQCIGKGRSLVQEKYDLSATANIPAVVPITIPIALSMVSKEPTEFISIRVSFTTPQRHKFYMELAMEPFEALPLQA